MKIIFFKHLNQLRRVVTSFDATSVKRKTELLQQISKLALPRNKVLVKYIDVLLFLCSHPVDKKQLSLSEKELLRILKFMQKNGDKYHGIFQDTGMPFSETLGSFSHDLIRWMLTSDECKINLSYFAGPELKLNEILRATLPSCERPLTWLGKNNEELLDTLLVKKDKRLSFIINELSKFDSVPHAKDQLYDSLEINISIKPVSKTFSKPYNRLKTNNIFFHDEMLKNFEHVGLVNEPLPQFIVQNEKERLQLVAVIKNSLTLMLRETDPSTYLDENSLRLYELERGISIAVYGMIPQRQHAFESYAGYTLFKNGFPAAYGGGWILGNHATFGINIFEPYRGGESGFIMCQLMRVYHKVFGITYFEVEPFQYGKNNPDGIKSGAFWFYYKYGFRPLDRKLLLLAEKEKKKFKSSKNYRSSSKTLLQFTKSNIAKNLNVEVPVTVRFLNERITRMIAKKYNGDRRQAVEDCKNILKMRSGFSPGSISVAQEQVLEEFSLLMEATGEMSSGKVDLLYKLIQAKPESVYLYQGYLLEFFRK